MRHLTLLLAILAAGPAAVRQGQQGPAGTAPPGAITGIVVDAVTGQPLAEATVSLGRTTTLGQSFPRMVTDAKGRFVYANLPAADDYYLGARKSGYEYTRYGWTAPGQSLAINDIARIAVGPGQLFEGIKIPLWRLPSISGRVVDERGEPVVGTAVRAFSTAIIAGHPQLVGSSVTTTDDRGWYSIPDLLPGKYAVAVLSVQSTVLASTPEAAPARATGALVTGGIGAGGPAAISGPGIDVDGRRRLAITSFATPPPPGAAVSRAYAAQFYPGVNTAADAAMIELGYGEARTSIDFQLRPVDAFRVTGRTEGVPAPGLLLRLMPAGSETLGFGSEAATTVIEGDGTFTFFNVPAGPYTLLALPSVMDFTTGNESIRLPDAPGFPGGGISVGSMGGTPGVSYLSRSGASAPSWGRMPVNVGGHIDNLVLRMQPMGTMTGRIAFVPGMTVPSNAHLDVSLEPANGDPTAGFPRATAQGADRGYSFTVQGLMGGTYLVSGRGPYYVVSVTAAGRDVTYSGVDASPTGDISDVVVTLTDKRPQINGTVTGAPGRTAGVMAFPVDRARWTNYGWSARQFRTTRAGSTGAFTLQLYAAGEYFLVAVDATKVDAWTNPKFLEAAVPFATRVTVGWGETKSADLTWLDVVVK
jgi:hypothetical protein